MVEPIPIAPLRLKLALLLLAIGVLSLALVPLTVLARLSPQLTVVLTGLCLFGIPQLLLLATIAVIGRPRLAYSPPASQDSCGSSPPPAP